jgi:hypothetical protein
LDGDNPARLDAEQLLAACEYGDAEVLEEGLHADALEAAGQIGARAAQPWRMSSLF